MDRSYLHGIRKIDWERFIKVLSWKAKRYAKTLLVIPDRLDIKLMERNDEYKLEFRKPHPDYVYFYTHKSSRGFEDSVETLVQSSAILHYGGW